MKDKLFRKIALDKMASPEQLDQLLTITTPRSWLILIVMALVIVVGGLWCWFGSISTKVNAAGMIVASSGVFNVAHFTDGQIVAFEVAPGDFVAKGATIAVMAQPESEVSLRQMRDELKNAISQTEYNNKLQQIGMLEAKLKKALRVTAPVSGNVLEIKAKEGEVVKAGQAIVSINMADKSTEQINSEMIMYVSAEEGKQVKPGMEVQITPGFVKKEQYGYMLGKVRSVSEMAVTEEGMYRNLGSRELVKKFLGNAGTVIEVRVELIKSPTVSGYLWSSKEGPPVKVNVGTICNASVVVKKQRPITVFFLQFEQLLRSAVE